MGNIHVDIFPPSYWQDFERLTLDVAREKWRDDYAERNGRQGQAQAGVDVYGYNHGQGEQTGVQCKKRGRCEKDDRDAPTSLLTAKEINAEVKAAKTFVPPLDRFIIATTGPRDAQLQKHARGLTQKKVGFKVSLWFWDDFVEHLNNNPDLMYRYYENVLKYREQYSSTEHYIRLIGMTFDRPAWKTPFHMESRATDFIRAISDTQNAISTGRLVDRNDAVIDHVPVPKKKPAGIPALAKLTGKVRNLAAEGLNSGVIVEHPTVMEIRDHKLADDLNRLRAQALDMLNPILSAQGIDEVTFDGL